MSMKAMNLLNFLRPRPLIPYVHGQDPLPSKGDVLIAIMQNQTYDFIAGFCGMDMRSAKKGDVIRWKVMDVAPNGSVLCQHKKDRILLNYLKWDDGNRVTVPANLAHSRMHIRFYRKDPEMT